MSVVEPFSPVRNCTPAEPAAAMRSHAWRGAAGASPAYCGGDRLFPHRSPPREEPAASSLSASLTAGKAAKSNMRFAA
jgi:hypothetical protein